MVIKFILTLLRILPCKTCKKSALQILPTLHPLRLLLLPRTRQSKILEGTRRTTRARYAQFVYEFHQAVNQKLSKSPFGLSWRDSLIERPTWLRDLVLFGFVIAWPSVASGVGKRLLSAEDSSCIKDFFGIALPSVLQYTVVGQRYVRFLQSYPLHSSITRVTNFVILILCVFFCRSQHHQLILI